MGICCVAVWFCYLSGSEYKDPAVPVEERVEDLLSRMTLDEKIARWE
ncbi:hypothetical protein [Parabacteroides sp. AM58-2XD]|nr:hypothetical protein [Parabacteroides sp. AM58-2XD]